MEVNAERNESIFKRVINKIKENRRARKERREAMLAAMTECERDIYLKEKKETRKTIIKVGAIAVVLIVLNVFFREIMIFIALGLMCLGELFGGRGLPD